MNDVQNFKYDWYLKKHTRLAFKSTTHQNIRSYQKKKETFLKVIWTKQLKKTIRFYKNKHCTFLEKQN